MNNPQKSQDNIPSQEVEPDVNEASEKCKSLPSGSDIQEAIISFKSTKENFDKEISGLKCNTFRKVDNKDERFMKLKAMEVSKELGIIEITCNNSSFKRQIKDITFYDDYVIISWNDEKALSLQKEKYEEEKLFSKEGMKADKDFEDFIRRDERKSFMEMIKEVCGNKANGQISVKELLQKLEKEVQEK